MNLIYIVEQKDLPAYQPNFTMNGEQSPDYKLGNAASVIGIASKIAVMAVPVMISMLPFGQLAAVAAASPAVRQFIFGATKDLSKEQREAAQQAGALEFDSWMREHAITISMAKQNNYTFPPGHPQVGQIYKRHPLGNLNNSKKINMYIPADKYDALLLEERESELIKMLVDLGAVKISITQKNSNGRH